MIGNFQHLKKAFDIVNHSLLVIVAAFVNTSRALPNRHLNTLSDFAEVRMHERLRSIVVHISVLQRGDHSVRAF